MPSKKSGGARQTEKIQIEREAKRPRGWAAKQRRSYAHAVKGKAGLELAVAAAEHAILWAGKDPGIAPESAREQAIRAAQTLGKLAQPDETIRELTADLREALAALEQVRESDGVPKSAAAAGGPSTAAH